MRPGHVAFDEARGKVTRDTSRAPEGRGSVAPMVGKLCDLSSTWIKRIVPPHHAIGSHQVAGHGGRRKKASRCRSTAATTPAWVQVARRTAQDTSTDRNCAPHAGGWSRPHAVDHPPCRHRNHFPFVQRALGLAVARQWNTGQHHCCHRFNL